MTLNKRFSVEVKLVDTNEVFRVNDATANMKIADLKMKLELIAGIPTHLQRIMYLDQGDMEDNSTLKHHDVVQGALLNMHIWGSWSALLRASVRGHIGDVMASGVTVDSSFKNPNTEQMKPADRKKWFLDRAAIALYVAAHRGHASLIKALIKSGVDIRARTKNGRTALQVAAASGRDEAIEILLDKGAGDLINQKDKTGQSALLTAAQFGHKSSERRLFLFQWRKRSGSMKKCGLLTEDQLMAHQLFDSSSKTWLYGAQSQMYQSNILYPQEFQGTGLSSKRSNFQLKKSPPQALKKESTADIIKERENAILTRGKRPNGTDEIPAKPTETSPVTVSKARSKSKTPDIGPYNERRLAYLHKYKPDESIKLSAKA